MDTFLAAAIEEAKNGLAEGGIPIGSVIVHQGKILGRGHNRRIQKGSVVLHGEMDALENAGRQILALHTWKSEAKAPKARSKQQQLAHAHSFHI